MLKGIVLGGAALMITTVSAYAEWMVIRPESGACFTSERGAEAGETQVGMAYATEAEAEAAMASIAECDEANTNPDPDEDDPGAGD